MEKPKSKYQKKLEEIAEQYRAAPDATPKQIEDLKGKEILATYNYMGYSGLLWSVEILYKKGPETCRHVIKNQTAHDTMNIRKNMFSVGLMVTISSDTWEIISPYNIQEIIVYKQSKYFEA